MKKCVLFFLIILFYSTAGLFAQNWAQIVDKSSGQTVYFHAWAGSSEINRYIKQMGDRLFERYKIKLEHVKIEDAATSIQKIYTEKLAGKNTNGSVDLIWVNGENFAFMKTKKLLYGPFTQKLPNFKWVDQKNPSILKDFNSTVDNMESPWGTAKLVFIYDRERLKTPPKNALELLEFTKKNPKKFSYPAPPNFFGTTFLKQVLIELAPNKDVLYRPYSKDVFDQTIRELWKYLDKLHKHAWGEGNKFPRDSAHMIQMLDNRQLDIIFTFNPNTARTSYLTGKLPESVRTYVHQNGTIGNVHFLAIPFNSSAKEAAMVTANLFLSPEAQAMKADTKIWGDPTVLDVSKLPKKEKAFFDAIDYGEQVLKPDQLGAIYSEPHSSWVEPLETAWKKRYYR